MKHDRHWEQEDNHYSNIYRTPVTPTTFDYTTTMPTQTGTELTADYTQPFANDAKLADVIARSVEVAPEPHALGDIIAEAPEVDDVASCPEIGRPFDKRGFEAGGGEPEGERRPSDPRA